MAIIIFARTDKGDKKTKKDKNEDNVPALDAAHDDMMKRIGRINAGSAGHGFPLSQLPANCYFNF